MTDIKNYISAIDGLAQDEDSILLYDSFDIELSEDFVIETGVVGYTDDGIIVEGDDEMLELLAINEITTEAIDVIVEDAKPKKCYTLLMKMILQTLCV